MIRRAAAILLLLCAPVLAEEDVRDPVRFDDYWDYNDPAGSERIFRDLRPALVGHDDASLLPQIDTQIARALSLQREFAAAHALLDEVEAQLETSAPIVRVRYLMERGRTHRSAGEPDRGRPLFEEAWTLGREIGAEALAVDAAHMVALTLDGDEAVRWNELALEAARASDDPKAIRWRGSLLNNLGWTYHGAGDFDRALARFEEALEYRREQGSVDEIEIAEWCVARCLRSLGRVEAALVAQNGLLARKEARGASQDGYVFEEIAECLLALGRASEATPWFAKAHEALGPDPWLQANEPERLERLEKLSRAGD